MPTPIYMWIKDESGAQLQGSVVMTDDRRGSIEVLEMNHLIEIPTDKHSGLLTGMRRHDAVLLKKAVDKSSVDLFQAVTTGRNLKEVVLRFYEINREGIEQEYYRITYEDVKITSFNTVLPNVKEAASERLPHIEEIALRYKRMTVNFVNGNLTHSDAWEERVAKTA
ncbi:MAG: type VI secretion system tube protein TssD [Gammaproteobacteria bacterium]